jgi:hypothetical protein
MYFLTLKGSLPCSQESATSPYPEQQILQTFKFYFPQIYFHIIIYPCLGLPRGLFPLGFSTKILYALFIAPCVLRALPSHLPSVDYPNNIYWSVRNTQLFILQFSPPFSYFIPPRFTYSPKHPVLRHLQSVFFPWCQKSSFIQIQNRR